MTFKERYQYNPKTDLLGKGGFSQVYKAQDVLLDRPVALKFFYNTDQGKYDVISEIRKTIRLNHPNIAMYYDVAMVETPDLHGDMQMTQVGIMEYINSGEIRPYLKSHHNDHGLLKKLLIDVLNGLEYLHRNGIIHRDLKPQNILVHVAEEGPIAKLADFGISKNLESSTSNMSSQVMGTIEYMAPEQFNATRYGLGGKIGTNLDLWSFGVMAYELLTDQSLFGKRGGDTSSEHIMSNILADDIPAEVMSLPEPFRRVIAACLVKDANQRVKTAREVIGLFEGAISHQSADTMVLPQELLKKSNSGPVAPRPSGSIPRNTGAQPAQKSRSAKWILWSVLLLLAAAFTYWILNRYAIIPPPKTADGKPATEQPAIPPGMVLVEGGKFMMGSTRVKGEEDASPRHEVTIGTLLMSDHETTNQEYADFLNAYGSDRIKGNEYAGELLISPNLLGLTKTDGKWAAAPGKENHPVVNVTWFGAWLYANQQGGRLPTEAEWEYAARGGQKSQGFTYAGDNDPQAIGWFQQNSKGASHPVKQKKPNELGIYDINGNVYEWCQDWYAENTYQNAPPQNPQGAPKGENRVLRGGAWKFEPESITYRNYDIPTNISDGLGFRIVKDFKPMR